MDDNLHLPMVTVINESTQDTVQTDMEGIFSIKAEVGHNLLFRYLGYIPRPYAVENLDFLTIGIKPDCNCDDFGWNRIYFGPSFDFNKKLFGFHIDYISNPIIHSTILNPKMKVYWASGAHNIDSRLDALSIISNWKTHLSAYFRYQKVSAISLEFENVSFRTQTNILRQYLSFGISQSQYEREGLRKDYLGFLVGYSKEVRVSKKYFPIEFNVVIWKEDLEINLEVLHRFSNSIRAGLQFQHYRDFDQLAFSLSYSLGLEKSFDPSY